ncbi:Protein kinase C-binding protein 1 [Bagarius yarrelli]|uniref:Protein kinase C-binding protein 1 n=1 Tax=Bagarius yarrelli TaxID=175774 RepID=A0A556V7W1_BAGYA|nr:Protein kinase C-binding protein 1 [Bagarius yarrelli]
MADGSSSPPCIAVVDQSRAERAGRASVPHSTERPITRLRVALKPIGSPQLSVAEEEVKTESDVTEGMEIATRSKVSDPGSVERTAPKRKAPSPPHSSNGHSSSEASPSPVKKKKKPGAVNSSKDQSELRHGPFYYVKQPALTTDPVDVVPQDGRNDFYCWMCHREGQVLCCELCPRVYHAKCLKLAAEPEGDWFCPECEKITVAECIETQSKAMTMLTLDQLSYLLKFALQKMKQPGNIKKKMYGSTEAFLADVKWILHNCIIYNGGNHKLTTTAKVIIKICEHEMNEIEVCPECYLSACQKRDNWFCEPCSNPHPLVWAKLKGFPFWPAKALRDKDGQVDARFFGQHDRAWVPINNCYLMSKEIPFSVKKTKSIFNSAMQEMEVYVENIRKKFAVFNYAPFRTPYTPDNQFQMLLDPANPGAGSVKPEKQEKIKFNFDMTASHVGKGIVSAGVSSGGATGRRINMPDIPRSPMSTNSSAHTGSDGEQEGGDKSQTRALLQHHSTGEESLDSTASSAAPRTGPAASAMDSPKPFHSTVPNTPVKQEKTPTTGSILNLNLDRSKAEMDLKELSETVQQQQLQGSQASLTSPKRQIRSRFQLNLDKTIESCKAQLGIDEISEDVYKDEEHSDSDDSDKSDSSDSEYISENDQKPKSTKDTTAAEKTEKEQSKKKPKPPSPAGEDKESSTDSSGTSSSLTKGEILQKVGVTQAKEKQTVELDKEIPKAAPASPSKREKSRVLEEARQPVSVDVDMDSDSERELVIDLGEEPGGRERKRRKKDLAAVTALKEPAVSKTEAKGPPAGSLAPAQTPSTPSSTPGLKDPSQSPMAVPVNVVTIPAVPSSTALVSSSLPNIASPTALPSSTPTSTVKKQRPLLPRESVPVVERAVVWNPGAKFQTSSQKWHMQKVQRQQQSPTQPHTQAQTVSQAQQASSSPSSSSTRYQTRQAVKAVQQKDSPHSTSTSAVTLVTSTPVSAAIMAGVTVSSSSSSSIAGDLQIPTTSADVAADIAKYTNKIMDAIKGTMTEIYNDLSKSTSGNTIAEIRRLRIEIEKLQWLHQQELSEMKHNLELTMAEMRQSLEQERERLVAEVKKQMEVEKQQAVDETKKKQWCANCKKEAIFYCCWNTSYCDYPCQQAHWPEHMKSCTQSATSQQEPDTEPNTDSMSKVSGHPNTGQDSPRETTGAPVTDKDSDLDKSKDSVTVSVS